MKKTLIIANREPNWLVSHPQAPVLRILKQRGFKLEEIEKTDIVLVRKPRTGKQYLFLQGYTPLVPYSLGLILSNKTFSQTMLKTAKLPVPEGQTFEIAKKVAVRQYVQSLGWPIWLRQENSQLDITGIGPITDNAQFEAAWQKLTAYGVPIVVEKYVSGCQLLVYIDCDGFIQILGSNEFEHSPSISTRESTRSKNRTHFNKDVTKMFVRQLRPLARRVLQLFAPMAALSFMVRYESTRTPQAIVTEVFHSLRRHYGYFAIGKGGKNELVEIRVADLLEK